MFNGLMLPHQLINGVSVPSSHHEEDHSWTLPPLVVLIIAEQLRRDGKGEGFSGPWSLQTNNFSNAVS